MHAGVIGWEAVEGTAWSSLRYLDEAVHEPSGRFRNFRDVDGRWLEAIGSEDAHGRAVLALGRAMSEAPDRAFRAAASGVFRRALTGTVALRALHARSSALIGCAMAAGGDQAIGARPAWIAVGARLAGTLAHDVEPVAVVAVVAVAGGHRDLRIAADPARAGRRRALDGRPAAPRCRPGGARLADPDGRRPGGPPVTGRQSRLVVRATARERSSTSSRSRPPRTCMRPRRPSRPPATSATCRTRSGRSAGTSAGTTSGRWSPTCRVAAVTTGSARTGCNVNQGAESTLAWLAAVERIRIMRGRWSGASPSSGAAPFRLGAVPALGD